MSLITLRHVGLSFGGPAILEDVNLRLERGERVCLLGRNGAGKSTLMKLINAELGPDSGEISRDNGLVVSRLGQEVPAITASSVFDLVADGLADSSQALERYHLALTRVTEDNSDPAMRELERAQHDLEGSGGWDLARRVETVLAKLDVDGSVSFERMSGGQKRRAMLARALVAEPDLLLLDEPTNHLDLASTLWLEEFLLGHSGSLLFVTHDRAFLQRLATRILHLDRGQLTSWPGDYANFMRRRDEFIQAEEKRNQHFDRKLATEETWIRQGIKARRTRNEGRVRALEAMRESRRQRRVSAGVSRIRLNPGEESGKRVITAEAIGFSYSQETLFQDFSTEIMRGDKVGILGPNGSGKTTLVKVLLGELAPSNGTVKLGTRLTVAYFDQLRAKLDDDKSILDSVSQGASRVTVGGKPRHIVSYLEDFLFAPERIRAPVSALSGGERNRVLLARLFASEFNLLVLDEPTNDLDLETLEILEQRLVDYSGTLLLVSHDRAFLDNVVTSTIVFEGDTSVREYVGGYADWSRQSRQQDSPGKVKSNAARPQKIKPKPGRNAKLSYNDERELASLPATIEQLEKKQTALHESLADPKLYREQQAKVAQLKRELDEIEAALATSYERWEQLESIRE